MKYISSILIVFLFTHIEKKVTTKTNKTHTAKQNKTKKENKNPQTQLFWILKVRSTPRLLNTEFLPGDGALTTSFLCKKTPPNLQGC